MFYGWLIVLIAFCGQFITAGTGGYVFGLFIKPFSEAFGWTVGFVSSMTFMRSLVNIVVVPLVGRITDRFGSRPVMLMGTLIGSGAFLLASLITHPILFYLVFSIIVALGYTMLGGIPSQAAVTRWFQRRRGMALSLVTLGISMGGVVMVPLVQYALDNYGWRFTLSLIGAGIFLVMAPPVFFFMRDYPEQMGLQPDGAAPAPPTPAANYAVVVEKTWTSREILTTLRFWQQALGYMFAFALLQVTLVHQATFITQRGFDRTTAAWVLSAYAFSAAVSKFAWGYLADRFDVHKVAVASNWLAALGLVLLIFTHDLPLLWVYALIGGWGIGGLPALQSIVTATSFGRKSYGTVAGLLNPMNGIASALAVPFAGYMFDATGSYDLAFSVIIVLVMVTSVSLLWLPRGEQ
jgi:MFS family permease